MPYAYDGSDRRDTLRLDYLTPLAYKICKEQTLSKLLEGYTVNVSEAGLLCNIKDKVNLEDILWLSFDRGVLIVCEELEKQEFDLSERCYRKVVRIEDTPGGTFHVGVKFITRQEKNRTKFQLRAGKSK